MEGLLTGARANGPTTQFSITKKCWLSTKYMEYYVCDHAHLYNISEVLASEWGKRGAGVNVDHEEAVYRFFLAIQQT